jgi:hypothetical protein
VASLVLLYQKLTAVYDKEDNNKDKDPGRKIAKKELKYVSTLAVKLCFIADHKGSGRCTCKTACCSLCELIHFAPIQAMLLPKLF